MQKEGEKDDEKNDEKRLVLWGYFIPIFANYKCCERSLKH